MVDGSKDLSVGLTKETQPTQQSFFYHLVFVGSAGSWCVFLSCLACLEKVLYLGKQATFEGEASPSKLAPQERTFRKPSGNPRSASRCGVTHPTLYPLPSNSWADLIMPILKIIPNDLSVIET
jgi:hypothetical protein